MVHSSSCQATQSSLLARGEPREPGYPLAVRLPGADADADAEGIQGAVANFVKVAGPDSGKFGGWYKPAAVKLHHLAYEQMSW